MAYVRSVRLAACRRQMVARRPHQPASHDGNLNLLKAPECSRSEGVTDDQWRLSHIEVPCRCGLDDLAHESPNRFGNLFRRSSAMQIAGTSHAFALDITSQGFRQFITNPSACQVCASGGSRRLNCHHGYIDNGWTAPYYNVKALHQK